MYSMFSFFKFSGVGSLVTVLSMITTFILLKIFGTPLIITYIVNYTVFVFISYTLNRKITFGSHFSVSSMLYYYLVYISGMILGVGLLYIFRKLFNFENWIYAFMVIPFTLVNNYLLSALVFRKDKETR